tara:strand:+ start:26555 stop:26695 length:141 start_codon:yes stop_codon:yes gene_type:complete
MHNLSTYDRVVCIMRGIVTATLTAGLLWNAPQILRVIQLYATGEVQ